MNEETVDANPELQEAFAAYVQAQENGQFDAARRILRDHPGLAEEVATYFANCTRVPKPWDSSANSYDGRTLGDFELLHELGRGGEGVVYKARQKSLQTLVAVKVMRHERLSLQRDVEQFRKDSILLASLDHPNIVRILYAGESENGPYFAMELMAESLKQKLGNGWLPTPKQAAELVRVLAEAMQSAHDNKIVHRDLKPANILLKPDGTPKIVDFGLAKKLDAGDSITQAGAIVGTISYMSPEQAWGKPATYACDVYGLGAILYELLTGRPPFVGATRDETLEQVRKQHVQPVRQLNPDVPVDLEVVCLKCLEKEPAGRYASAQDLAADLGRFLNDEHIVGRVPGITERALRMFLRHQFTNVTAWGWILVISSISGGMFHLVLAWCISTLQPEGLMIKISIPYAIFLTLTYLIALYGHRLENGDRQGIAVLIALLTSAFLLPVFIRPHGMDLTTYRLALYPLLSLLHGVVMFIQGAFFWSGYYLCGFGYFLLGIVMQIWPSASPILFGAFYVATMLPIGIYMLGLGRSPEFAKR